MRLSGYDAPPERACTAMATIWGLATTSATPAATLTTASFRPSPGPVLSPPSLPRLPGSRRRGHDGGKDRGLLVGEEARPQHHAEHDGLQPARAAAQPDRSFQR